ncbi:MAG TPA: ABC transporter substrate-binding protein [Actinomycetota bacterium]|jgi:branched-chain amino acid transport system substrate-binding protein|nr:ABC transporter substrate-binding protein [Actinomycetota bacterium]
MVGGTGTATVPRRAWLLVLLVLVLAAAGCGRSSGDRKAGAADPGITDSSIKLGGSYPFSGPASAYGTIAKGANAYFKFINDQGGVNGRKIEFVTYDDGYEPQRALTNAKKLVEQDKVFALFNTLGTANNIAIWDYANQQKVPQVFVATGSSVWGKSVDAHPYTIGWQPNYLTEAKVYAEHLKKTKPNAKVAVLYQNDAYGKELLGGFEAGIAASGVKVVDKQPYEATAPTVASQVKKLAGSGADVFLDITTPKFAAQAIATVAQTTWKPLHILNNVAASKAQVLKPVGLKNAQDIVSTAYVKDPEDAQWANDPAMVAYKTNLAKYESGADANDPYNAYGWAVANNMVEALKQMKQPTRAALMDAARNLNLEIPLLLPGIKVQTSGSSDGYPIEAMQITQFKGENFQLQGEVIQAASQ